MIFEGDKMAKTVLITGVTGQDGSYLAELLLEKKYEVYGMRRRSSSRNIERVEHLYLDPHEAGHGLSLKYGDMIDTSNIVRLIKTIEPDEIYHLAAQSHVRISFEIPEYTAEADALGALKIMESIRVLDMMDKIKFYQASTSELYGNSLVFPQNEQTPFRPCSPYATAKLYAYWITVNYREAYNMFASNGILFNHESPRRGHNFVTRKITRAVARIYHGLQDTLYLGNMESQRDWGYAPEYVDAMWRILQRNKPDDYVIATGEAHSVREFVEAAFAAVDIEITWKGSGVDEIGINAKTNDVIIRIDPWYFRPAEVHKLIGDYSKAKKELGWEPTTKFEDLVAIMVKADLKATETEIKLKE
jgi:GDPmannose 4,6-dehydratase